MHADRNPNEGMPDVGPLRPERTKFKNIDWIAYESVHKKYLSIGETEIEFPNFSIDCQSRGISKVERFFRLLILIRKSFV